MEEGGSFSTWRVLVLWRRGFLFHLEGTNICRRGFNFHLEDTSFVEERMHLTLG